MFCSQSLFVFTYGPAAISLLPGCPELLLDQREDCFSVCVKVYSAYSVLVSGMPCSISHCIEFHQHMIVTLSLSVERVCMHVSSWRVETVNVDVCVDAVMEWPSQLCDPLSLECRIHLPSCRFCFPSHVSIIPSFLLSLPPPSPLADSKQEFDDTICPHILTVHTYTGGIFCDYCGELLFGLLKQGLKCQGLLVC